ncbi:hypothetical protein [Arthrobacter sp. R4-81]
MPDPIRFTYQCGECGKDIKDREGYLWISVTDAYRVKDERRNWQANHPPADDNQNPGPSLGGDMRDPDEVHWAPLHSACDPRSGDVVEYTVGVEEVRTSLDLLNWALALLDKDWFEYTNWNTLVHERIDAAVGRSSVTSTTRGQLVSKGVLDLDPDSWDLSSKPRPEVD